MSVDYRGNGVNKSDTFEKALQALRKYGYLWTNDVNSEDRTTRDIGKRLVDEGYAVYTLTQKGYDRLGITYKALKAES